MTFDTKQKSSKNKDQIMPSKKKKYNARFPAGRIKKIMQTDEEVGKVAQAVPVIISRTLELFVESLLKKSMQITQTRNAKTLTPSHMKQCILSESRFDFLKDLVKDIPDASIQEDNENNAIFEDSLNQTETDAGPPVAVPSQSSKRKHSSSTEGGSKERVVHKIVVSGINQPKKRKQTSTEVSSTSTSSNISPYPVPPSPHLPSPSLPSPSLPSASLPSPSLSSPVLSAANFYKDHQQQQTTVSRTPVIQYTPKITQQNQNQSTDGAIQASQLTFSVNNLLSQNVTSVISEEPNLRITIASEHLPPPPLAISTAMSSSGSVATPRLAPSDNVPPLVPLRMPSVPIAASPMQQKYMQTSGDLSIDEDYDN